MSYKITYNQKACIGVGQCATMSKLWKMNNQGKAILQGAKEIKPGVFELEITDAMYTKELAAINSCPVQAIQITKM